MLSTSSSSTLFFLNLKPLKTQASTIRCASTTAAWPKLSSSKRKTTLYEVLRVDRRASLTEIKNAYRGLAKLYHPDVVNQHPEADGSQFVEIRKAYDTLSDPIGRAVYDMGLVDGNRARDVVNCRWNSTRRWETDQCW